jgi:hypothetical protein
MNENFNNGFSDDSPNRQSPTAPRSRTSSQSNGKSSSSNNRSNNHSSNGAGSPLSNDSMLTSGSNYDNNVNCDNNLRNNIILGSVGLNDDLLNGSSIGNGINDIMFGAGSSSDNKSNIGTLPTSLIMSQTSPSHNLNNVQTPTSIPSIVFSGKSFTLIHKTTFNCLTMNCLI